MKLHISVVDRLVTIFENYGGHRGERKLREMLAGCDFSTYNRESGESILVFSEDLSRETAQRDLPPQPPPLPGQIG